MSFFRWLLALLLFPACLFAGDIYYGADLHQAAWQLKSSRLRCTLGQEIPGYGRAEFVYAVGDKFSFHIHVLDHARDAGVAKVYSAAPAWMHDVGPRDLGQIKFTAGGTPFVFSDVMARRLLLELQQGMFLTLSYQDWADGRDYINVTVSSVSLQAVLPEFYGCWKQLLPYNFDYVRHSRLQFAFNSSALTTAAKKRLDEVASYLLADAKVKRVTLLGRTDNVGFRRYNETLAKQRTAAVRDYLLAKGVRGKKVVITVTGEKKPLASNETKAGRALNRSVDVTLSK